ncbi:MAG: Nmad5 family putative nucleotide modification protein [Achromobacter mucicolens]
MNLNKTNREEIILRAIAAAFSKRDKAHQAERTAFADALYTHTHGSIEKAAMKLPQEWRVMRDGFEIACDGFRTWGNKDGAPRKFTTSKSHPYPVHNYGMNVEQEHPLYSRAQAIVDEHNAIERGKEALRAKLHALVHSFNTVEKLQAAWPEGAKFMPDEPEKPANLPVPANLSEEINAMMGIRPSKAKAAK